MDYISFYNIYLSFNIIVILLNDYYLSNAKKYINKIKKIDSINIFCFKIYLFKVSIFICNLNTYYKDKITLS